MNILLFNCLFQIILGFFIIFATSPINAIIGLIGLFFNAAFMLFNFGFDFFGLIFVIIYVGAIAVLFLFIIMMLSIKYQSNLKLLDKIFSTKRYLYLLAMVVLVFLNYRGFDFSQSYDYNIFYGVINNVLEFVDYFQNIEIFGNYFYNFFNVYLLVAGLMLLVALVGAVILTASGSAKPVIIHRQDASKQLTKTFQGVVLCNSRNSQASLVQKR